MHECLNILYLTSRKMKSEKIEHYLKPLPVRYIFSVQKPSDFNQALVTAFPDIILMDGSRDFHENLQTLRQVSGAGYRVPLVFLALKNFSPEETLLLYEAGMADYVTGSQMSRLPLVILKETQKDISLSTGGKADRIVRQAPPEDIPSSFSAAAAVSGEKQNFLLNSAKNFSVNELLGEGLGCPLSRQKLNEMAIQFCLREKRQNTTLTANHKILFDNSEENFRLVFEEAPMGLALIDRNFRILNINKFLCKLLGFREQELIGRHFTEISHPDEIPEEMELSRKIFEGQISKYSIEKRLRKKSGEYAVLRVIATIIRDKNNRPLYGLGMAEDITERKRIQAKLHEQQQTLNKIISSAPLTVILMDMNGKIRFIEGKGLEKSGMAARDFVGKSAYHYFGKLSFRKPDGSYQKVSQAYQEGLKGKHSIGITFFRNVYFDNRIFPFRDSSGKIAGLINIAMDITEQELADKKIKEYAAKLQSLSHELVRTQEKERRKIARELHDDIGHMLTTLDLKLNMAGEEENIENRRNYLGDAVQLLRRIMQQSRQITSDLRIPLLEELGLVPAVRSFVKQQEKNTGLKILLKTNADLERLDMDTEIQCYRIIQEAVTNVIKHASASRVKIEICKSRQRLKISVTDNGSGFNPEKARERAMEGKALGLSGMEERAVMAGGHLKIETVTGAGTKISAIL